MVGRGIGQDCCRTERPYTVYNLRLSDGIFCGMASDRTAAASRGRVLSTNSTRCIFFCMPPRYYHCRGRLQPRLQALTYDIRHSGGRCRKAMLGVWLQARQRSLRREMRAGVKINTKLQALVYDILSWRKVPESDARSVDKHVSLWRPTAGRVYGGVPLEQDFSSSRRQQLILRPVSRSVNDARAERPLR